MKNYDIAIGVNADKEMKCAGVSNEESIKYIKKAGFKKVFISWVYDSWGENQERIYRLIKENNLQIVFAHVGYKGLYDFNKIWLSGKDGDEIVKTLIKDLQILKNHNINIAVVHPNNREKVKLTNLGLKRWGKIIKEAEKIGITIAIENLRYLDVVDFLIDNIKSPNLKVCYDAGHDHCHSKDSFNFQKFKDLIVATHIHDNNDEQDLHLIPFHGNINWKEILQKLKENNKEVTLSGEIYYRLGYKLSKPMKFYKQSYKVMKRLYDMYKS